MPPDIELLEWPDSENLTAHDFLVETEPARSLIAAHPARAVSQMLELAKDMDEQRGSLDIGKQTYPSQLAFYARQIAHQAKLYTLAREARGALNAYNRTERSLHPNRHGILRALRYQALRDAHIECGCDENGQPRVQARRPAHRPPHLLTRIWRRLMPIHR